MNDWHVIIAVKPELLPRETPGVYLLFSGNTLDYAGQSEDVRRRLMQEHHVYDPAVHRLVALIQVAIYDARLGLERYFNQKYNPANSYIGSGKQSADFDERFLHLSPDQRRTMWVGPAFDEFELPEISEESSSVFEAVIPAGKISMNLFQAPSVISLPPEELLGF